MSHPYTTIPRGHYENNFFRFFRHETYCHRRYPFTETTCADNEVETQHKHAHLYHGAVTRRGGRGRPRGRAGARGGRGRRRGRRPAAAERGRGRRRRRRRQRRRGGGRTDR